MELGIFPMSLYAGAIYGLLLFMVIFIGLQLQANLKPKQSNSMDAESINFTSHSIDQFQMHSRNSEDTLARMKELKELRSANLITEDEYEAKRKEILRGL